MKFVSINILAISLLNLNRIRVIRFYIQMKLIFLVGLWNKELHLWNT